MRIDAQANLGQGFYTKLEPHELLAMMDEFDIDRAIVCSVDEYVILHNRAGNDFILKTLRQYPDRFMGFAVANPWYGKAAVEEARRAIGEGLRGLEFNSTLQAFFINDEIVYPLIELAQALDVPVYFHTATPIFSLPLQLADLAEQFPDVRFIMGHAAAADFWIDALPAVRARDNIYVESSLRSGNAVLQALINEVGAARLMFGSAVPNSHYGIELAKIGTLELSPQDLNLVMGGTILKVMKETHA